MPKKPRVRTLMDSQQVKGSDKLLKMHGSIFVIFFYHLARKSAQKILFS